VKATIVAPKVMNDHNSRTEWIRGSVKISEDP